MGEFRIEEKYKKNIVSQYVIFNEYTGVKTILSFGERGFAGMEKAILKGDLEYIRRREK